MTDYSSKKFSIGDAAKKCGVTVKQIRNWEEREYIPKATRIVCGERAYRYFSEDDLDAIRAIKSYLDQGFTLQTAVKKAAENLSGKAGDKDA